MQRPREPGPGLQALQASLRPQCAFRRARTTRIRTCPRHGDDVAPFGAGIDVYRNNAWQFFLDRTRAHLRGDGSAVSAPISSASLRTNTAPGTRRDTATCTGSARPSRHGSHAAWRARVTNGSPTWRGSNGPATSPRLPRLPSRWAWSRSADSTRTQCRAWRWCCSLRCGSWLPPFPIWSVWQSNQDEVAARPVDLDAGAEHCVVACVADRVAVYRLDPADHRLLQHLCDGLSLESATAAAAADAETLARLLGWAFGEGLVVQVVSPSAPA